MMSSFSHSCRTPCHIEHFYHKIESRPRRLDCFENVLCWYIKGENPLESELATTAVILPVARGRIEPLARIREQGIHIVAGPLVVPRCCVMLRREGIVRARVRLWNWNRSRWRCRGQNYGMAISLNGETEAKETDYTGAADW